MCSCKALLNAIDNYIQKADDDLADALKSEGYAAPKKTVKWASKVEDAITEQKKRWFPPLLFLLQIEFFKLFLRGLQRNHGRENVYHKCRKQNYKLQRQFFRRVEKFKSGNVVKNFCYTDYQH